MVAFHARVFLSGQLSQLTLSSIGDFCFFSKNYCSKIILTIAAEVENESKNKIIRSSVLHFATVSTLIMNSEFSVLTSKCDDVLELNQSVMKPNEPSPRFYSIAEAE